MELFGVAEIPTHIRSNIAPGWAYVAVPDSLPASQQPTGRKRAARNITGAVGDTTAKQDAKVLKSLAELDKDSGGGRDVQIPVPVKARDGAGRISHGKVTPNVRRILQSQKTFANHLSDAEALAALTTSNPQAASSQGATTAAHSDKPKHPNQYTARGSPAVSPGVDKLKHPNHYSKKAASPAVTPTSKRGGYTSTLGRRGRKKGLGKEVASPASAQKGTPLRRQSTLSQVFTPTPVEDGLGVKAEANIEQTEAEDETTEDPTAASPTLLKALPPNLELKTHPADNDPLLKSRIPNVPSEIELQALIAAPALSYLDSRGTLSEDDARRPTRSFCEICGYWGRVRCLKCGTRVCALECLRTHSEDCYTRYGA